MGERRRRSARVKCAGFGCSTRFTPIRATNVYCSKICKARAHWRRKHPRTLEAERTCERPGCGNSFSPLRPNHVFCSERCQILFATRRLHDHRQARYSWKVPRVCARLGCGGTFTPARSRQKCCSAKCRRWLYLGTIDPPERVCARPDCGASFRSRITKRLYCSQSCQRLVDLPRRPKRFQRHIDKLVTQRLKALPTLPADSGSSPVAWQRLGAVLLADRGISNEEAQRRAGTSLSKRAVNRVRKKYGVPGRRGRIRRGVRKGL